jgi:hypothetical protein
MSKHGTALSDDTIIRVDRSAPVVYPHYWWLKNVAHRAGSVCLSSFSGLISGMPAGFRPPRSATAG